MWPPKGLHPADWEPLLWNFSCSSLSGLEVRLLFCQISSGFWGFWCPCQTSTVTRTVFQFAALFLANDNASHLFVILWVWADGLGLHVGFDFLDNREQPSSKFYSCSLESIFVLLECAHSVCPLISVYCFDIHVALVSYFFAFFLSFPLTGPGGGGLEWCGWIKCGREGWVDCFNPCVVLPGKLGHWTLGLNSSLPWSLRHILLLIVSLSFEMGNPQMSTLWGFGSWHHCGPDCICRIEYVENMILNARVWRSGNHASEVPSSVD